jgi:hypothetical protein
MPLNIHAQNVRTALTLLENDQTIKPIQKALILQVADDKKPATWLIIDSKVWFEGEAESLITDEYWSLIDRMLTGLALSYIKTTRIDDTTITQPAGSPHKWVELGDVYIARDLPTARELKTAVETRDERRMGELFAFPDTAIEGYLTKRTVQVKDWPKQTAAVTHDEMQFLNHMFSIDNWENEISYLPDFASNIKRISPAIYAQCIDPAR